MKIKRISSLKILDKVSLLPIMNEALQFLFLLSDLSIWFPFFFSWYDGRVHKTLVMNHTMSDLYCFSILFSILIFQDIITFTACLMFCLFWQFALSSAILTVCTMSTLFQYSDKTLVFAYFLSFGLSGITLSFMISTFFTRAKTAVAVGTLSFLGAFFPYYTVNDETVSMLVFIPCDFLIVETSTVHQTPCLVFM